MHGVRFALSAVRRFDFFSEIIMHFYGEDTMACQYLEPDT